jgi:ubiquinone/menaquinone biosynthesis C-methylase UbiE
VNNQKLYNSWSATYNQVTNRTRDLEAKAIRSILANENDIDILELGCGTGKNTVWLATKAKRLIAFDFSQQMMAKAKQLIPQTHVQFIHKDITQSWAIPSETVDLITCSLVLEHIADLKSIFLQAQQVLRPGGIFYMGELHPIKQYLGSKARFETNNGTQVLDCYTHHITDYTKAAASCNLQLTAIHEFFDEVTENDTVDIPRILSMVFKK